MGLGYVGKWFDGISYDQFVAILPMMAWGFLDSLDCSYFRGIMRVLEIDLNFGLANLSVQQSFAMLAPVIFGPVWGFVMDQHILSHRGALVFTALGWGTASLLTGLCARNFWSYVILRFICGIFICSALPVTQHIVTTHVPPNNRGMAFSMYTMCGSLGVVLSSKVSTTISEYSIFGLRGWRFGLVCIGLLSYTYAAVVMMTVKGNDVSVPSKEKARRDADKAEPRRSLEDVPGFWSYASIRSFWVLILQCCVAQTCIAAMTYSTMFFQYSGLTNSEAGTLLAMDSVCRMVGTVFLGYSADVLQRQSPHHGRLALGQVTFAASIPLCFFLFYKTPRTANSQLVFMLLLCVIGFVDSGWSAGVNRPLLSMLAPSKGMASLMAIKMAIVHVFAAVGANAIIYEVCSHYGYHSSHKKVSSMPLDSRVKNANALGNMLTIIMCVGGGLVVLLYGVMHWTYRLDLADKTRAEADELKGESEPLLPEKKFQA